MSDGRGELKSKVALLFPEIASFILRDNTDFGAICEKINDQKPLRERFLISSEIPEGVALYWAHWIGDRDIMRDLVTSSFSAYLWARELGDKEIMRARITEPEWAVRWAEYLGDKEVMRPIVMGSEYEEQWFDYVEKED